jgi:hypothetical protein
VHAPSSERPVPPKLLRESQSSFDRVRSRRRAAAASVTPDRTSAVHAPSSERPVPLKLPRESRSSIDRERSRRSRGGERHTRQGDQRRSARRAASGLCRSSFRKRAGALLIKSDKDTAVAASVTPDRAISGARAEQRAACAAQASEGESSSYDRERSRRSCGGERHTRLGDQRCTRRAASGLCRPSFRKRARAASIESAADAAAAASVTPDWAISGARAEQRAACAAQASEGESSSYDRERSRRSRGGERHTRLGDQRCTRRAASGLCRPSFRKRARAATIESAADAAAAASVTPDRAISGARAEQRADCAAQASEGESSSYDRERSRRSRGGERYTRLGDQRCTRRAASGLCRLSLRERARAASIESMADAAAAASVTPDRAISGARAEQRAACAAQAPEREQEQLLDRERSRRSCGGERHTRLGDQRCTRRAASGLCRPSF